jgi:hypothetical protein
MEVTRVPEDREHGFVVIDPSSRPCAGLAILCKPLPLPMDLSIKPRVVKGDNVVVLPNPWDLWRVTFDGIISLLCEQKFNLRERFLVHSVYSPWIWMHFLSRSIH